MTVDHRDGAVAWAAIGQADAVGRRSVIASMRQAGIHNDTGTMCVNTLLALVSEKRLGLRARRQVLAQTLWALEKPS